MPRIPREIADKIKNGEVERGGRGGKALQGYVLARLIEAEEGDVKESGSAGQNVKLEVIEPAAFRGTWVWDYLSYSEKAEWKWDAFFEGFGFEADSDTDEIVEAGEDEQNPAYVVLEVSIEYQQKGKNKGRAKTRVEDYLDAENEENRKLIGVDEAVDSSPLAEED